VPGKERVVPGSALRARNDDKTTEDEDEEVYVHTRPAPTKRQYIINIFRVIKMFLENGVF
jgi:hypothetical protein